MLMMKCLSQGWAETFNVYIGRDWKYFMEKNGLEIGDKFIFTFMCTNQFFIKLFHLYINEKKGSMCLKIVVKLWRNKCGTTNHYSWMFKNC